MLVSEAGCYASRMRQLFSILCLLPLIHSAGIGCASFHDRELSPTESAAQLDKRTLLNPLLANFIEAVFQTSSRISPKTWNLDRLTLAALYYHPDLALARAQAETADAAITTAGQRLNPSLKISPTWVTAATSAASPWIIGSYLNVPIETAGKRDYRIDKSKRLADAAHLRIADTAWLIRQRLRLALLEAFAAEEAERITHRQYRIQQALDRHLQQQLAIGEIEPVQAAQSQLALNQSELNAHAAVKRVAESRVLLASAIGIPIGGLAGIDLDFSELSEPPALQAIPVEQLRQKALLTRPDILAALADYAAAQSALQLEIANQYPNFQANPSYTWDLGAHYWTLAATALSLPVFHQNQGQIAEAEARRRESAVRFENLQMRIIGDIDRAYAGVSTVLVKWRDAEKRTRLEQQNLDTLQAQYQAGEIDHLTVLTAELARTIAERTRLDTLVETQQALNGLENTLRRPIASTLSTAMIADGPAQDRSR
jgi:cobalt-zinc-cadmium efflux system outer membrane protein